ncbi:DUF7507 domain-containing protein [Amycolatopsis suaedae]|uniref:DUF11 domain-containing protein n=1 Tax=Amycolatopsis suaedae TaxID=2510978 RepID=A0A4Q7JF69_9PSEU|nr:DUF11 domain-containing protein [Amycolatopsis suaedae]RZQ65164.1 DUF11 domain-containing protein [Amycolatopsis suaedae]
MSKFRLAAAALLVVSGVAVAQPAEAGVVKPFSLGFNKVVYGDFAYTGNAVLRCPVASDGAPQTGDNTPAACQRGANQQENRVNDNFFMQWSDVDSDAGTFNSSRTTVRIPPGSTVEYARLNWAGNTGSFHRTPGRPTSVQMCQDRNRSTPAELPPGSPRDQAVRLSVGTGGASDVAPASYADDPSGTFSGGQYYSAFADVTAKLKGMPTGTAVPVTVGNVWAPKGFGCMGGWSLAVVYSYPQRDPVNAPSKREVFFYDGHVRQNSNDPTTNTTISGFRAAAAGARVGVTAYEGDYGITGDKFLINDQPAGDPNNFFVSDAQGAQQPNNYSVDARAFDTGAIPAGATSAKLGFATSGDAYLAQHLAFSVPVPELQLTKTASPDRVHAGEQVTFTLTVTNPSGAPARDVRVADPAFPQCAFTVGTLAGGASASHTCTVTAAEDDFTNTATATGTSAVGEPLDGTATTEVDVVHPAVDIAKRADREAYRAGDTVTFTIVVTNTGDVPLTSVTVADPKTQSCARTLPGSIEPAGSVSYTCTTTAPVPDGVNTATVNATDPLGAQVTATADAPAPTIAPALKVDKSVDKPTVRAGEQVTWTIVVTNTGDSPLTGVKLADDTTTACSVTFDGTLEPGASRTHSCTANPGETTTNTVTASGTDRSGQQVEATDSATVTVINPALKVDKSAAPATVRQGDTVTFTIVVTNTGDVALTGVSVSDSRTPECARTIGTLEPRASQTHTCTTTAPADDFTNTATATGNDPTGRPVTVTDDAAVDVIHPAVTLDKQVGTEVVREGDQVTFTVVATNTGDVPLTGVTITDERAPGCAATVGTLAPGAKHTVTCTITAPRDGFTNTATVTGDDPTGRPVTATDDAAFRVVHPAVTIAKDVIGGPFREGDQVTFQITVTNTGDVPLTGVAVADELTASCAQTYDEPLQPGGTWGFGCFGTAPADDFTNVASVTGTPPVGPAVSATDDAPVDVIHPGIEITKTATPTVVRPGGEVTFRITVTNTGDSPLRDVFVADPSAPSCAKRFPGQLAAGATQTYECTHVAGDADFTNTARANGTDGTNRAVTDSADAAVDVIHPAIAVTKTAEPAEVLEGDTVRFTILVTNTGDVPLTGVTVADDRTPECTRQIGTLEPQAEQSYTCTTTAGPSGFTNTATASGDAPGGPPVTASDKATFTVHHPDLALVKKITGGPFREGDPVPVVLTVTNTGDVVLRQVTVADELAPGCARVIPELAPGASQTVECTMPAPKDDVINKATVTGTPPVGPPITTGSEAPVDVIHPGVQITKTAVPDRVRAGEEITFTIVVRNTGDVLLRQVAVADPIAPDCARTVEELAVGGVLSYTCVLVAGPEDVTNTATVTGNDPTDRPVTATDDAKVDVIAPQITVTKTGPAAAVRPGQKATFTVRVQNVGDVPLTGVTLKDDVAPGCSVTIGDLGVGAVSEPVTCEVTMGDKDITNTVTATGYDPNGKPVTATAEAVAKVLKETTPPTTTPPTTGPGQPGGGHRTTPPLAKTGVAILPGVALGAGLLIAGAGLLLGSRRGRDSR